MRSDQFLKKLLFAAAASLLTVSMFAQNIQVSGTVTDEGGFPVIGASVMIPGTTTGVVTDIDGKYTLSVDSDATLEISSIGYNKETVKVGGRTVINVVLSEDKQLLEDVVVVGYAVGNKRSISGAIERVTAEDMNTGYVASAIDAIRGKVPGLVISSSGGSLDSPTVRLRGTTSLSGGSDPLVIIDGSFSSLEELDEIASQDIEEISVLKDASESAQYGSRGAAGVIVVTTKRGEQGKAAISYQGQFGISTAYKQLEMLSAEEWRDLNNRKFNGSGDDLGANTNWFTWVQNPLVTQNNHNLSLTQGTTKGNIRASIGFNQRNGLIRGTGNNTYNMRLNASQKAFNNKLNLELNLAGTYREGKSKPGVWSSALVYNPTYPSERNPETGMWDIVQAAKSMTTHPGELMDTQMENNSVRATASGRATYTIIDGLNLSAFGSFGYRTFKNYSYYPNDVTNYQGVRGEATIRNYDTRDLLGNLQLSYVKEVGKHSINALALVEAQSSYTFNNSSTVQGFDTNYFKWYNLEAASTINWGDVTSQATKSTILSYMGRLNYMYDDRYVVTVNLRADGSSKLGANHKWGFFPSASAAWIISNESFMKNQDVVSNLKLRVGYGVTGNQSGISPLRSLNLMAPSGISQYNGTNVVTFATTANANPDLKWETKHTFDVGLDFGFWGGRLYGTLDYYRSTTKDMLYTYAVSVPPFEYSTLLANLGEMQNNGFEFSIGGEVISTRDLGLSLSASFAHNENTLVSLEGTYQGEEFTTAEWIAVSSAGGAGMVGNNNVTYMAEGYPVGIFRLPVHDGFEVDENGHKTYKMKDLDNSGGIDVGDSGDREILGQVVPKLTANFNARLRWKQFDAEMQINGAFGHHIYNFTGMYMNSLSQFPLYNVLKTAEDLNIYDLQNTSYWLERGDYAHIEYITVGYTIPLKSKALQNLRVALSCNNIATITGYSGLTPLINSANYSSGVDARNITPLQRTFTLHLSLRF